MKLLPLLEPLFAEGAEVFQLENGLTVVSQEQADHPLFSVQVWIRTGSMHEGQYVGSGLSHFLEHMVFKGSSGYAAGVIPERVQAFGGQINAYTAFDRTVYYIDGPYEKLEEALELLHALTLGALLPQDEWQRERDVILHEIDMNLDDLDRKVMRGLFATAFRDHPFRHPVIGHRHLFEQVTCPILEQYYRKRYQPDNIVLSVVGRFDPNSLREAIDRTFGQAKRQFPEAVAIPAEPRQIAIREKRLYGDCGIMRGSVAFKIPSMRHEDAPAIDLLAAILGSGYSSRLRQIVRDEAELVHHVSASAWNPGEPGLMWISYQCDADKGHAAEAAIIETCTGFADQPLEEAELDKAKRFAWVSEIQSRQTISGYAARLGLVTALVGDQAYPRRYFEQLDKLTPDAIRAAASQYMVPHQLNLVSLQPESYRNRTRVGSRQSAVPDFEEKLLPNGARLIWQPDSRLPRTSIRFCALGGPAYEQADRIGSTSLLSTLMTKDSHSRSAVQIARILESNGGFMQEVSGNHTFSLFLDLAPDQLTTGLDILSDAVCEPAFREPTLIRERSAQIAGLREQQDEIIQVGRIALRRHYFGNIPFANEPEGTEASVSSISRDDLIKLHQQLVTAQNSVLVVAGDFDPDQFLPKVETWLAQLPAKAFTRRPNPVWQPALTGERIEHMQREQAVVFAAYPDPGFLSDLDPAAQVLDEILSDMSGPLFRAVREDNGLAYFVGAARMASFDYGCFYLYAGTHPKERQTVWDIFEQQLHALRNGHISQSLLDAARTRLIVHNRFSLQTSSARAGRVALNAIYQRPIMDWLDYEAKLNALTRDSITQLACDTFDPAKRLRYAITPIPTD